VNALGVAIQRPNLRAADRPLRAWARVRSSTRRKGSTPRSRTERCSDDRARSGLP